MHRNKAPLVIGRDAKEEGAGSKFTFGTATVEGQVISLTGMREIPNLAKKLKDLLKSQKIMMHDQIPDADSKPLGSNIEDDLPEDPDLEGGVADDETDDDDEGHWQVVERALQQGAATNPIRLALQDHQVVDALHRKAPFADGPSCGAAAACVGH
jgi:hypothetical protein